MVRNGADDECSENRMSEYGAYKNVNLENSVEVETCQTIEKEMRSRVVEATEALGWRLNKQQDGESWWDGVEGSVGSRCVQNNFSVLFLVFRFIRHMRRIIRLYMYVHIEICSHRKFPCFRK